MVTPTILINDPPPRPNQPLINVAPPLPSGPLVNIGQLNLGTRTVTTLPDLGATLLIQTGNDSKQASIVYAKLVGKQFDPVDLDPSKSKLEIGKEAHRQYGRQAFPDELVDKAIRNAENAVQRIDKHYGRPDLQDPSSDTLRDLKPVPSSVPPGGEGDHLLKTFDAKLQFYEDLYQQGWGREPNVYVDWYRMPDPPDKGGSP